ncbi:hypothetical protein Adt_07486 [Abeliophyllum distichum]|uniref:Uncharacterized protein n=1 Tax=Abeliophyllum distichum TaxID=126358 RepID=A0ABD1V9W4_9LAMI
MAKIIITIIFLCLFLFIADRLMESNVKKTKNVDHLKVYKNVNSVEECISDIARYHRVCSTVWVSQNETAGNGNSFQRCCQVAYGVSDNCAHEDRDQSIFYLKNTCKYANASCTAPPKIPPPPSPLVTPPTPQPPLPPTPENPSPMPHPPIASPSPTPEQPSPNSPSPTPEQPSPIPHPPSVSPSPTPEQPSPNPKPPSVSPPPTPEQPSPIPQPPSVYPPPTPEQPSPISQPPVVSPPPTPEQPSPNQPTPAPSPIYMVPPFPFPRPNPTPSPLVPPPPPNHPIRAKNCQIAFVDYDSCNPVPPDVSSASHMNPYELQFNPPYDNVDYMFDQNCCLATQVITNKCNDHIRDMSYGKLRIFKHLEDICSFQIRQRSKRS